MHNKSEFQFYFTIFVHGHKDTTIFEIQKIIIYLSDKY